MFLPLWTGVAQKLLPTSEMRALYDLYVAVNVSRVVTNWNFSFNSYDNSYIHDACIDKFMYVSCYNIQGNIHIYSIEFPKSSQYKNPYSILEGSLPASISDFRYVQTLRFDSQALCGIIPYSIGELNYLKTLMLSNNKFSGSLPSILSKLSSLEHIDLYSNQLTGSVPNLQTLSLLKYMYFGKNKLNGTVPEFVSTMTLSIIDLSRNSLVGTVPSSLSILGGFSILISLNDNHFSGRIPAAICKNRYVSSLSVRGNSDLECYASCFDDRDILNHDLDLKACDSSSQHQLVLWFIAVIIAVPIIFLGFWIRKHIWRPMVELPDVYIMHTSESVSANIRIFQLVQGLENRGLTCLVSWREVNNGAQNASVVVPIITERFRNSINNITGRHSAIYKEFQLAMQSQGAHNCVPVVMDSSLRNTRNWQGELGAELGNLLYVDCSQSRYSVTSEKCEELKDNIMRLLNIHRESTDCFLTHSWAADVLGRDNHERVRRVFNELVAQGLRVWFDSERMVGNVRKMMTDGIENTQVVIVFITDKYRQKINDVDLRDNCKYEFKHSFEQKGPFKMLPVVMEPAMMESRNWGGELGAALSTQQLIDLTEDDDVIFKQQCWLIYDSVMAMILGTTNANNQNDNDLNEEDVELQLIAWDPIG